MSALPMTASAAGDAAEPQAALRARLFEAKLLYPLGVTGLYGYSATYQSILDAVDAMVTRWGTSLDAERIYFPPVIARSTFDHTNYLQSFPHLMGSVHIFTGDDREHRALLGRLEAGQDWPALLEPAEVVLSSATCHSLYPLVTGTLPAHGRYYAVRGTCFRHEPSVDPTRMQSFGMHEVVFLGEPADAQAHRDVGLAHGLELLSALGLVMEAVPANDPFFGRLGTALAVGQLEESLKMEGVTTICPGTPPTAIMSANCHRDHFGRPFAITTADGAVAHSSCVAFGVDRIAIALLQAHGLVPERWPADVIGRLWP
ncbi:MAG TPA: amino acid--[acyl-carrier-protein] ligase [Acidimicrobiales bacterium]|nr:amino acid--[acyl-carrier-protein] ligase [Acidimicrobiales bacterium]